MRFKRLLFLLCTLLFTSVSAGNGFAIRTVVIDAGHGGKDPGAIGASKTNEKDIALAVALKLGDYIQKNFPDVNVIYTRKTDLFLELHERADIANQKKADLFICIHCNSTSNPQTYGTSTYVLGLHRTEANLEVAKRENSVILMEDDRDKNYEFDPNTPEGHIIMSMKQNAFLDQSIDIASKIENEFESFAKRKSLGVRQAGFYVLYKTTMPSLLSEIGFISNPQEEKFLNSAKGQDQMANAIFKAFSDYKFEMENSKGEQIAYEEAKKKSENRDTSLQKAVSNLQTKSNTEDKSGEPAKVSTPAKVAGTNSGTAPSSTGEPSGSQSDATSVMLSGRRIRKPISNASGGGITEAQAPPKEQPVPVLASQTKSTTQASDSGSKVTLPETKSPPKTGPPVVASASKETSRVKTASPAAAKVPKETSPVRPAPKPKVNPVTDDLSPPKQPSEIPAHKVESGNIYKVQIFAVKVLKNIEFEKIVKLFPQLSTEELSNGIIRYYAGDSGNYSDAKNVLETAVNHGYKDAFIVGFKNGVRMTPNQLKTHETD